MYHQPNVALTHCHCVFRPAPYAANDNLVNFDIPRDELAGYVNNQRENYEFKFNGVIGPDAKQDEVFERVASKAGLALALPGVRWLRGDRTNARCARVRSTASPARPLSPSSSS
jgi:hypothetical protein